MPMCWRMASSYKGVSGPAMAGCGARLTFADTRDLRAGSGERPCGIPAAPQGGSMYGLSRLSDQNLVAQVARLAAAERNSTASLIAHLAELYGRRLHERAGYSSLFTFCTAALHLSEYEAYDRMRAAKVARRYPGVLGMLASGQLTLTTIRLLAPHLTPRNHQDLFAEACGK